MVEPFERPIVTVDALPRPAGGHQFRSVRVDEQGVWLDGVLTIPTADVSSVSLGLYERTTVSVRSRTGPRTNLARGYAFTFTDRGEAEAMLTALGREPARSPVEIDLEPALWSPAGFERASRSVAGILATFAGVAFPVLYVMGRMSQLVHRAPTVHHDASTSQVPAVSALLASLALLAVVVWLAVDARRNPHTARSLKGPQALARMLEIGADGLRVESQFGASFLSYRDIAKVEAHESHLVIVLASGRSTKLAVTHESRLPEVVQRIQSHLSASRAKTDDTGKTLGLLAAKTGNEIAALRELGAADGGSYRESRLPRERLWAIVEDPSHEDGLRARAAVALSGELPPADRQRLRIAAECTVSPKLRVAIDAAFTEPDERLADRLDAVEKTAARARPREG